ncbi:Putative RxLR effector [Phytophthora palmivora]|uniref:RxLR effector protein n=1 Tax=Phytophthora palmivora TaxID=4796 RepID=A0A2P4XMZ1_9STRA|nr:Putative RxLR effector [Phytophthora palmivora]
MRLKFSILIFGAVLLATTTNADDNSNKRLLRRQEQTDTANGDEERWNMLNMFKTKKTPNDFTTKILDNMLSNAAFKVEMFEKWNKYSVEKILKKLDVSKSKNIRYASMLQDFLNIYHRRGVKKI